MKNEVSEKYRKYLISYILEGSSLLSVWGTDMNSPDQEDKLLLDHDNKILVFENGTQLRKYLFDNRGNLYDSDNFSKWIKEFNFNGEVYNSNDIDYIINSKWSETDLLIKEFSWHAVGFLNLFQDYAYQISDKALINRIESDSVMQFKDHAYSKYFWTSEKNPSNNDLNLGLDMKSFLVEIKDLVASFCLLVRKVSPPY